MITNTRFRATTSKRVRIHPGNQLVSVIELRKHANRTWFWVGNDGHTYSVPRNARRDAENDAMNGNLRQGGTQPM